MKYCSHCGKPVDDDAVVCLSCGCSTQKKVAKKRRDDESDTVELIAKIFMIVSCVVWGWTLIPLIWMIPMTVHVFNSCKNNLHMSTGFKVCVLLFQNLIAGIALCCRNEDF